MADTLDGCPEFDARVLDAAFDPVPDPAVAAHLARCARCRAARAGYERAGAILAGSPVPPPPPEPAPRGMGPVFGAVGAGLLLVGGLWIAGLGRSEFSVEAGPRARVRMVEGRRARVESGTARFRVRGARAVVETPRGEVRADDAEFDVTVDYGVTPGTEERDGGDAMTGRQRAGAAVTVAVAAGVVWWMASDGPEEVPAGRTVVRTPPVAPVPAAAIAATPPVASTQESKEPAPPSAEGGLVLRGRTVDFESGAPLAGARVLLVHRFARVPGKESEALTAADGAFRVAKGESGFDSLLVLADGYAEFAVTRHRLPAGVQGNAGEVDVGEIRVPRGARIAGRVVAADGLTPVAAARLLLGTMRGSGTLWIHSAQPAGASGADGAFEIARVSPSPNGWYCLYAVAEGGLGWAVLPATAGESPLDGLEIRLARTATATVVVRRPGGEPVPDVLVVASPRFDPLGPDTHWGPLHEAWESPEYPSYPVFAARTDAEGKARFGRIPVTATDGAYDFIVRGEDGAKGWKDGVRLAPGREAAVEIVLPVARLWAVTGFVHDWEGNPVAGGRVVPRWGPKEVRTGEDGRFRVEGLEAGWDFMGLEVEADGFAKASVEVRAPGPDQEAVAETVVKLLRGAPVSGRVVDQDGAPIEGVQVSLMREREFGGSAKSGADGSFSIPAAGEGEWNAQVMPPPPYDGWARDDAMPLIRSGDRDAVIVIRRVPLGTARLVVEVVDADTGESLTPAEAMLIDAGDPPPGGPGRMPYGTLRIETGRVVIERAKAGRWHLWVRVEGRPPAKGEVEVPAGAVEATGRVDVGRAARVRGRVAWPEGEAPRKSMVFFNWADIRSRPGWASHQTAETIDAAYVREDGAFEIENLPPGKWRIHTNLGGFFGETTIDVPSGGEVEARISLERGAVLLLRLGDASPTDHIRYEISRDGGPFGLVMNYGGEKGKRSEYRHSAAPGRVRWRVVFNLDNLSGTARLGAKTQEGGAELRAGETVTVEVPVEPR